MRVWTPQGVLEAIRARHEQGLPLFGLQKIDRGIGYAARKHWGSWERAVAAAGIPKGWKRQWDREEVLELLRQYAEPGVRLSSGRVPDAVLTAAYRWFDRWHDALAAAGLVLEPRPTVPRKWKKSEVLGEIRARALPDGILKASENRDLARAARKHFGSWSAAFLAAGLDARPRRSWSRTRVLEELRAWKERGVFTQSTATPDQPLACAASRFFGSWRAALVAAGVLTADEKPRRKRTWNGQKVIEAIQDRYIRGLPLIALRDRSLATAAARYFGGWHDALLAAGVEVGEKPQPHRQWTRQGILEEIQARYRQSLPLTCQLPGNRKLAAAAARYFGSWTRAVVAAGIPVVARRQERWDKKRVLAELRAWDRRGRPGRKLRGDQRLSNAAIRYFGSWRKALAAAGLVRKDV